MVSEVSPILFELLQMISDNPLVILLLVTHIPAVSMTLPRLFLQ